MFHFYQKLIALRHSNEIIVYGTYQLLWPDDRQILAYTRRRKDETLLVVCNLSGQAARVELPREFAGREPLIANMSDVKLEQAVVMRPWEAFAVLENAAQQ